MTHGARRNRRGTLKAPGSAHPPFDAEQGCSAPTTIETQPTREDAAQKYIPHSQGKRVRKRIDAFLGRVDRDALQADRICGFERHRGEEFARGAELLDAIFAFGRFMADVDAVVGRVNPESVRFAFPRRDLELPRTDARSAEVPQFPIALHPAHRPKQQHRARERNEQAPAERRGVNHRSQIADRRHR